MEKESQTKNDLEQNLQAPSPEYISSIIGKLETLRAKKLEYVNQKFQMPVDESSSEKLANKTANEKMLSNEEWRRLVEEVAPGKMSKGEIDTILSEWVKQKPHMNVDESSSEKPDNRTANEKMLSAEELLRLAVEGAPKEMSENEIHRIVEEMPGEETAARLFGDDSAAELLNERMKNMSTGELQQFLNEILPKFLSDPKIPIQKAQTKLNESILTDGGKRIYCIMDSAKSELHRRANMAKWRTMLSEHNCKKEYWAINIAPLVEDLKIELAPYMMYFLALLEIFRLLWHENPIEIIPAIESEDPKELGRVIFAFRAIKRLEEENAKANLASEQQKDEKPTEAEKPAETERKTTLFGKILEKVLYIFTRSFWDAVFDRYWHK
jgi:hypothetical protein